MAYLSVHPYDHGSLDFGCTSYGGLAYRDLESNSNGNSPKFISEHNLALYWRRPGLYPQTTGFPLPLLETVDDYCNGIRNRPPGNLRYDSPSIRVRNRNLLATELTKSSNNGIRLWAVNDFADHKQLLEYDLELEKVQKCKPNHLLRVFRAGEVNCKRLDLPNEAMELRTFSSSEYEGKLFVRNKHSLALTDMLVEKPCSSTVFKSSVQCFQQIPYMQDELAVVGSDGFLFWGKMGGEFARVKSQLSLKEVCPTDCPRVLLAISEKELIQKDLRVFNGQDHTVYSHNYVKPALSALPDEAYDYVGARETFCHINSLDVQLETILLTTTRRHFLIDRRMTNRAILSMSHAEMDGGDYCLMTPNSFRDPETGGLTFHRIAFQILDESVVVQSADRQVFSLYVLSQIKRPALSRWAVMFHPKENLWSSLGSKYDLDSPRLDIPVFINSHAGIAPLPASSLPVYTRAISYLSLPQQYGSRSILFRQMDGGEIWYENVVFDPSSIDEDKAALMLDKVGSNTVEISDMNTRRMAENQDQVSPDHFLLKKKSVKFIRRYLRDRESSGNLTAYICGVDPEWSNQTSDLLEIVSTRIGDSRLLVLPDVNRVSLNADPFEGVGDSEPIATSELESYQNIAEGVEGEGRMLSSIVLQMWNKMSAYYGYNKSIGRRIAREEEEGSEGQLDSDTEKLSMEERQIKTDLKSL